MYLITQPIGSLTKEDLERVRIHNFRRTHSRKAQIPPAQDCTHTIMLEWILKKLLKK